MPFGPLPRSRPCIWTCTDPLFTPAMSRSSRKCTPVHRAQHIAPLASRDARTKAAAVVAGALINGGESNRLEFVQQIGKGQRERFVDVAFDVQPPGRKIHFVWDAFEMPANKKCFIGSDGIQKIVSRRLELHRPVG